MKASKWIATEQASIEQFYDTHIHSAVYMR